MYYDRISCEDFYNDLYEASQPLVPIEDDIIDEYGELIRYHHDCPQDALYEIINILYNSYKIDDSALRKNFAYLCHYYKLNNRALITYDNMYVPSDTVYCDTAPRAIHASAKDAIITLIKKLYISNYFCYADDIRPDLAYLLDVYGMDSDIVDGPVSWSLIGKQPCITQEAI